MQVNLIHSLILQHNSVVTTFPFDRIVTVGGIPIPLGTSNHLHVSTGSADLISMNVKQDNVSNSSGCVMENGIVQMHQMKKLSFSFDKDQFTTLVSLISLSDLENVEDDIHYHPSPPSVMSHSNSVVFDRVSRIL